MKQVLRYLVLFVGLIAAYLLFAVAVTLLPSKPVERHVEQTLEATDLKADFWFAFLYKPAYFMDNFTDALIVNQAMCNGRSDMNVWERVMLVPRMELDHDQCENLRLLSEGDGSLHVVNYPRYWHGSTFLMRLLLTVDDYVVLRTFFYILSSMLLLWVLVALLRRMGAWAAAVYMLAMLSVNVFMMQFSIQFLPMLVLALTGTLVVLYHGDDNCRMARLFFILGSLTAYFDLLTCPLLSWGIPMLVWLAMKRKNEGKSVQHFAVTSALWAVGYAATWAAKWLVATMTTSANVFADATDQAMVRASVGETSRWGALVRNVELVPWLYAAIALVVLILFVVHYFDSRRWRQAVLCLVVALAPMVWFMAISEHSWLHYWFTYRIIAITVMGVLMAAACLVDWRNVKIGKLDKRRQ